jgi:hypothetical protein
MATESKSSELTDLLDQLKEKNSHEKEFIQSVDEVVGTLEPLLKDRPE